MIFMLILLLSGSAVACEKGCSEYQGLCACDQQPEKAVQTIQPSDEKPPRDKMPSYEREGIHADMPPSAAAGDMKLDQEKTQADFEGKKTAGL